MNEEQRGYLSKYSKKQRLANWFSYNKWGVLLAALLLFALARVIWDNASRVSPDYQFAYVGAGPLPADTVSALETALAAFGTDLNGDGRVTVKLNQYPTVPAGDADGMINQTAWETKLMADLLDGESWFFLLDDPDAFQRNYQVLAQRDGQPPADGDIHGLDKVYPWNGCPALSSLCLGSFVETIAGRTVSGENQDLLKNLYVGRRCPSAETGSAAPEGCTALWEAITGGASESAPERRLP